MERALPLLTAAVLLAALAGCSAGADDATVPPAAERGLAGNTSTTDVPSDGSAPTPGGAFSGSTLTTGAASSDDSRGAAIRPSPRGNEMAAPTAQSRPMGEAPTGEAKARIVAGPGGILGQNGHGAYVCKVIGAPTGSMSSAEGAMPASGMALAINANESGSTVLELPVGENNLATYCTDPGGAGPNFTGTSAAFVITAGGSTDVEITAAPHP
jgi:hypothetical protein